MNQHQKTQGYYPSLSSMFAVSANRQQGITQASDPNFDSTKPLKSVSLPIECLPRFLAIAKVNTEMNKETCGLLLGKDKGHK